MAVVEKGYSIPGTGGEFARALRDLYKSKGLAVPSGDVIAWACSGELFLSHFLCGVPMGLMRSQQYGIRECHGTIRLDCSDYDQLYSLIAGSPDAVGACMHLPDADGALHEAWVDRQLILDMFDFCRDGIG